MSTRSSIASITCGVLLITGIAWIPSVPVAARGAGPPSWRGIRALDGDRDLSGNLSVEIKTRRPIRTSTLRARAGHRLTLLFDTDKDPRADVRGRILWRAGGLRIVLRSRGAVLERHPVDRVAPRSLRLDIPAGSPANPGREVRVAARIKLPYGDCHDNCWRRHPKRRWKRVPAAPVSVDLSPVGTTERSQGEAFHFIATVTNPTDQPRDLSIPLELISLGSGKIALPPSLVMKAPPMGTTSTAFSISPAQWFAETGEFELRAPDTADHAVVSAGGSVPLTVNDAEIVVPRFQNVTEASGISFAHQAPNLGNDFAAGAAWADIDGDKDLDLYVPQQGAASKLFLQGGDGSFTEGAQAAGVTNDGAIGIGATFADHDNDGDQDLYVVNNGANRLYRNLGDGTFIDGTVAAGVGDEGAGASASWGDYDADGLLDLYVTNYGRSEVLDMDKMVNGEDRLYRNNGDGTFSDATASLHASGTTEGLGFQAAWFDADGDHDQDLYLANDFTGPKPLPNVLWRNDGFGPGDPDTFSDISQISGAGLSMNAMGIGIGDPDRDLDLDIALSNMGPTVLLENQGGVFSDRGGSAGVQRPWQRRGVMSITWGLAFADLNNDSWEDLYVGAGEIPFFHPVGAEPNALFVNTGGATFLDLSAPSGAADDMRTRGISLADFDRDGRIDIYVMNQNEKPRLYRNVTPDAGHWIEIDTIGLGLPGRSSRDGCGALLTATLPDNSKMVRQVDCGSTGLAGSSDKTVHFGLGDADHLKSLEILWPSGELQTLTHPADDLSADRFIEVTEPTP